MKVFIAEFTIFNAVYWKNTDYKITAPTMKELEKAVMNELRWMAQSISSEEKWESIQKNIVETEFVFPIIEKHIWDD